MFLAAQQQRTCCTELMYDSILSSSCKMIYPCLIWYLFCTTHYSWTTLWTSARIHINQVNVRSKCPTQLKNSQNRGANTNNHLRNTITTKIPHAAPASLSSHMYMGSNHLMCANVYIYIHMYAYAYICRCMYIYIYTHVIIIFIHDTLHIYIVIVYI